MLTKGKFCFSSWICTVQSGTVLCLGSETLRDFTNPRSWLISPGIKLESTAQGRLSVVLPVHWLPTGNKMMHCRARVWKPDESQSDHSDHSDQLSATGREGHTQTLWLRSSSALSERENSLYFWVSTESLLPSYHHLAEGSSFITIKQRQFGFGRSLWNVDVMVNLPQTSHGFGFCHGLCVWKWEPFVGVTKRVIAVWGWLKEWFQSRSLGWTRALYFFMYLISTMRTIWVYNPIWNRMCI